MRNRTKRSQATTRVKGLLSLFGIIACTIIINSYMQQNEKEIDYPNLLYGMPTYPEAKISYPMSSVNGNPYIAVFLSGDSYEKVLEFYREKLKIKYRTIKLGSRGHVVKTFYQFVMQEGLLANGKSVGKGVEVHPLNARSELVYKAKTKIKIILPKKEVEEMKRKDGGKSGK